MRTLLAFFSLISFIPATQAAEPAKAWPTKPFKHVVGYCYDFTKDPRGTDITFPDGSIHHGVIQATTVRLSEDQAAELGTLLTKESDFETGGSDCYDPHHAFVFYDADWKVVASIDLCFLCEDHASRPVPVSAQIDLTELEKFCGVIGLPLFDDSAEYTRLFEQEQGKTPAVDPEKAPRRQPVEDPSAPEEE
jgi:hypothetical protein